MYVCMYISMYIHIVICYKCKGRLVDEVQRTAREVRCYVLAHIILQSLHLLLEPVVLEGLLLQPCQF